LKNLRVVLIKPSKYDKDGYVERFRLGFMPNATLKQIHSMMPKEFMGHRVTVHEVDEYVGRDIRYLELFKPEADTKVLVAMVGTQSHQFHRALDLAAVARRDGAMSVIGGPHPMTCDTTMLQGKGPSFSLSEAEVVLPTILRDAALGQLQQVYGDGQRWAEKLDPPVLISPTMEEMSHYLVRMAGVYPTRGCPYKCTFCSVTEISGHKMRSQPVDTTIRSLIAAKKAGVKYIMFVSDNFNKYPEVRELLGAMIEEKLDMDFFCQCDVQIGDDPKLIELMARAGCWQIFVGAESFDRAILKKAGKPQNYPEKYAKIVQLCRQHHILSYLSNILGFPDDTESIINFNLEKLIEIGPTLAAFYTFCPLPGSKDYQTFRNNGWIWEKNLDRFDATCPTWQHPHLSADDQRRLFARCYHKFYSLKRTIRCINELDYRTPAVLGGIGATIGATLFSRYAVAGGRHPMSGGIGRLRVDHVDDYLHLRAKTYGFIYAPLPDRLEPSEADQAINAEGELIQVYG